MKELKEIRAEIDELDSQLVTLMTRRLGLAADVAEVKKANGAKVYDPVREQQLLKRLADKAGTDFAPDIQAIYATILSLSKARQCALLNQNPTQDEKKTQPTEGNTAVPPADAVDYLPIVTRKSFSRVTVVGMGLIGASLYKAAVRAGYDVTGIDRQDNVEVSQAELLLLALPSEVIPKWFSQYGKSLKDGAVVVDTCGIKAALCRELKPMIPETCTFVGGHPMAGREVSGLAYADSRLFQGASMILTPFEGTDTKTLQNLADFFGTLGFAKVLDTTPEHHDRMIAFTSQLGHVIAAAYAQEPLSAQAAGFAAGSYANMTRIASMNPEVWEKLFSSNRQNLLDILDGFIERLNSFRKNLAEDNTENIRNFISKGAEAKAHDGVSRQEAVPQLEQNTFGKHLKLTVSGASHAPSIRMKLENFPRGFQLDQHKLQAFMERRAPGRDALSTSRREPDVPQFNSGLVEGRTTGETIDAIILNTDTRPQDYGTESRIPRPGHADFTQWIQTGRIPTGGGAHSGRMTAPLCVAGGICLQWLEQRGVTITARLAAVGGQSENIEQLIAETRQNGDSLGGLIKVTVTGLPPGLGGAMFDGVETELAAAMFSIPGVKGVEFGDGFRMAEMHGSQSNDPFIVQNGNILTADNHHGGLLGGITDGMPLVFSIAMKPTPSIFLKQQSVDLEERTPAVCAVKGRHDPCIARRAVPVAEALAAFVMADMMLADEAAHPRLCLTLTEQSITQNLEALKNSMPFVDMCELRVDCLAQQPDDAIAQFPKAAAMPVILTVRRQQDGGRWNGTEDEREALIARLLESAETPFAFLDLEDDFRRGSLEMAARRRGTRIIRSVHDFNGPIEHIVERAATMRGSSDDIPKLAFAVHHCSELERVFNETKRFTGFPHIICAMGEIGQASRILAERTHSMLTFVSPDCAIKRMKAIGQLTPRDLVRTYGFRNLTEQTALYAVTGWPLGHTRSPELNNTAFFEEANPAVMVPIPAETAEEALKCAETLGVRGMAVTIPHKQSMMPLMTSIAPEAAEIGAVNTVIRTVTGWHGANTDCIGFKKALLAFLECDNLKGRKVAIIGAGGAAQAIAYAVAHLQADACVFNRTLEKARILARKYGFKAAELTPDSLGLLTEYADIIIQTTSVGMSSCTDGNTDPMPFFSFKGTEALYDLVYSPAVTPLMARAKNAGCKVENGLSMLMEQAREQRRLYKEHAIQ